MVNVKDYYKTEHDRNLAKTHKQHHMRPEWRKFDGEVYQNLGWSPKRSDMELHMERLKDRYFVRIVPGLSGEGGYVLYARRK